MSTTLFELAVHYGMGLSFESAEKKQEFIDWYIENHEETKDGIIFNPKLIVFPVIQNEE